MNFESIFVIAFVVVGVLGLLIALASAVLFCLGNDCAGAVGTVSPVASIVLSAISMVYTYTSGVSTLKTIRDLKRQNDALVKEIINERSKDNYDETSEENAFR